MISTSNIFFRKKIYIQKKRTDATSGSQIPPYFEAKENKYSKYKSSYKIRLGHVKKLQEHETRENLVYHTPYEAT